VVTLLYGLSLVLFYKVARQASPRPSAIVSLVLYPLIFTYLIHIVFWFSDLTYVLELVFINLSIYLMIAAVRKQSGMLVLAGLAYACAVMAKEPSIVLVPAVTAAFLWSEWCKLGRQKRRVSLVYLALISCAGAMWLLVNPYVFRRQGLELASGFGGVWSFVSQRWRFYANRLSSGAGIIVWIATAFLVGQTYLRGRPHWQGREQFFCLAASVVLSLAIVQVPGIALAVLFALMALLAASRHAATLGAVWSAVPLAGILAISYVVRTYLVEASLGLAMVAGAGLVEIGRAVWGWYRRRHRRVQATFAGLAAVLIVVGLVVFSPSLSGKVRALHTVSETRQNLRSMVDELARSDLDRALTLVVVEYEDMGLDYVEDILPLSELPKARRQKTMTGDQLQRFLRLAGLPNVEVRNLAWLSENPGDAGVLVLAMNAIERRFLESQDISLQLVFAAEGRWSSSWLFQVGS
jgi:4-amino-4-deoxy-L-arabinose transferase-like glycosyltransferase